MSRKPTGPSLDLDQLVEEQRALVARGLLTLQIDPMDVNTLVGLIQLALRHPGIMEDENALVAVRFIDQIKAVLADFPMLTRLIDAGWQDLPNDYLDRVFEPGEMMRK